MANNNVVGTITLRKSPSVSAYEIMQIPLGHAVGFIENAGNGFYKTNYDGVVGYALAQYLASDNRGASRGGTVVNCRQSITLRKSPSISPMKLCEFRLERV